MIWSQSQKEASADQPRGFRSEDEPASSRLDFECSFNFFDKSKLLFKLTPLPFSLLLCLQLLLNSLIEGFANLRVDTRAQKLRVKLEREVGHTSDLFVPVDSSRWVLNLPLRFVGLRYVF